MSVRSRLQGRETQFHIELLYGVLFVAGFVFLVFRVDPRVAAFEGGLVVGYLLRVWEKMSIYERIIEEAVSEEAEQQVASEVEDRVGQEVEDRVGQEVEDRVGQEVADEVQAQVPDEVEAQLHAELDDRIDEEVEERLAEREANEPVEGSSS